MNQLDIWSQTDGVNTKAGVVTIPRQGAMEFEYDREWLAGSHSYPLDPELPLATGIFTSSAPEGRFRFIWDVTPDKWGRQLLTKRLSHAPSPYEELEFTDDASRLGNIRITHPNDESFLATPGNAAAETITLEQLLRAAEELDRNPAARVDGDIARLLEMGSTQKGARPKANISEDGSLYIAKFPKAGDDINVSRWEYLTMKLACQAGLNTPPCELRTIAGRDVFLTKRFDREGEQRLAFQSAYTFLEADQKPVTYLDIAEALEVVSSDVVDDLQELWSRMVFSVLINNTDDHLGNHGVLRRDGHWKLSPLYDVNPDLVVRRSRRTNVSHQSDGMNIEESLRECLRNARDFRYSKEQAERRLTEIQQVCATLPDAAQALGILPHEIEMVLAATTDPR